MSCSCSCYEFLEAGRALADEAKAAQAAFEAGEPEGVFEHLESWHSYAEVLALRSKVLYDLLYPATASGAWVQAKAATQKPDEFWNRNQDPDEVATAALAALVALSDTIYQMIRQDCTR